MTLSEIIRFLVQTNYVYYYCTEYHQTESNCFHLAEQSGHQGLDEVSKC